MSLVFLHGKIKRATVQSELGQAIIKSSNVELNDDKYELGEAYIPEPKISQYLLKERDENDKSKWLETLGYSKDRPMDVAEDILGQFDTKVECYL